MGPGLSGQRRVDETVSAAMENLGHFGGLVILSLLVDQLTDGFNSGSPVDPCSKVLLFPEVRSEPSTAWPGALPSLNSPRTKF